MSLLQRFGKNLKEGKDLASVSVPVELLETRSVFEKLCDLWSSGLSYVRNGALEKDPVERLK